MNSYFILFLLTLSCIKPSDGTFNDSGISIRDKRFSDMATEMSLKRAVKELPNYLKLKKTVNLVLVGKHDKEQLKGIKVSVKEMPSEKIIYNGQGLGLYLLPKSRITLPLDGLINEVQTKVTYLDGEIETKNYTLDERRTVHLLLKDL